MTSTILKRNNEIILLRKQHESLRTIAKQFSISPERVRQIVQQKIKQFCEIHKTSYSKKCRFCETQRRFDSLIKQISKNKLLAEISKLSEHDRHKDTVIRRRTIIRVLRDKYKLNFSQIGKILNRDHTSILHLYNK